MPIIASVSPKVQPDKSHTSKYLHINTATLAGSAPEQKSSPISPVLSSDNQSADRCQSGVTPLFQQQQAKQKQQAKQDTNSADTSSSSTALQPHTLRLVLKRTTGSAEKATQAAAAAGNPGGLCGNDVHCGQQLVCAKGIEGFCEIGSSILHSSNGNADSNCAAAAGVFGGEQRSCAVNHTGEGAISSCSVRHTGSLDSTEDLDALHRRAPGLPSSGSSVELS